MRTIIAAVMLAAAPVWAAAPVGAGKVFSGSEGERVSIIPLTASEGRKALLFFEGTGSELDGKVFSHDVDEQREQLYYTTQWRGRDYTTLSVRTSGGHRTYTLAVPGRANTLELAYDEKRTEALKSEPLFTLHQKQQADGTLGRLMAFDRKGEQAGQEQSLAEAVKSLNAACGTSVTAQVAWDTVSDEVLKSYSISSYCASPLSALERLCTTAEVKKALQAQVSQLGCQFGAQMKLELKGGRVSWTTSTEASNAEQFAVAYFEQNLAPPDGLGKNLSEWLRWDKTAVCTDGKGHYVVAAPEDRKSVELFYGDGSKFVQVPPPPFGLTGHHFLEPRFFHKSRNSSFRGLDLRVYSEVELEPEKQTCAVRCGEQTTPLTLLPGDKARQLLSKATYGPNPQKYAPYALLRDSKGRYYLVDRGLPPEGAKRFRVFVGPKGSLQQLQMVDLVTDSEGEIFSTKKGELRLVVDRLVASTWIENEKRLELRKVPIEENLPLIYNDLGVYTGERLGTPCDDL